MGLDYLTWLADLERPTTNALEAGPLAIQLHPAGAELPALTCLVQRLARRFVAEYPEQALTRRRVAVVVSMAAGSAPAVYGGGRHAAAALAAEVRELAVEAGRAADAVLVQTLPFGACGDVVDEANSAITAAVREAGVEVVAVHRVATFDAFVAAEDFAAAADALRALGRHERIGFLWNMLVDAAWAHWQVLVPATAAPKVIATDLDGVLWAGTIAEDGIDAALNGGGPLTRLSHAVWRTHLRRSASRGVLVAALSKNSADQAEIALRRLNPPLGTAGVWACEQIDKAAAVGEMLASFDGVAPAHLVLVDDNPGQQELLRAAWPQATVPAVAAPLLVADLLRQVPIGRGPVTSSDRQRGAYYKAKASGQLVPEVTCLVDPDDPAVVERLAQLHARTNQFNMTTPRRSVGQLCDLIADPHWNVLAFRVTYHGSTLDEEIIGCAEIHYTGGQALLDSFLASCRLLWAGAQQRMFDQVRATARTHGYERLTARWRPNGRNEAYRRWFAHIGWSEPADDGTGLCFSGTTATRDGQAPADLLAVMSRYLTAKTHGVHPPNPIAFRLRAADRAVEVRVPAGRYRPGLTLGDIDVVRAVFGVDPIGEQAGDPVTVAGFWMDCRLVNRTQFAAYLSTLPASELAQAPAVVAQHYLTVPGAVVPHQGTEQLPAVVPHPFAQAYATHVGGRLPTELEWEYAARGGDERWYPWGVALPDPPWCLPRGSNLHPVDHNQDSPAPFGLVDLVGHVWQWCADQYRDHPQYRGGDTRANLYFLRTTVRPLEAAEHCGHLVGFRVVRDLAPDEKES